MMAAYFSNKVYFFRLDHHEYLMLNFTWKFNAHGAILADAIVASAEGIGQAIIPLFVMDGEEYFIPSTNIHGSHDGKKKASLSKVGSAELISSM